MLNELNNLILFAVRRAFRFCELPPTEQTPNTTLSSVAQG